MQARPATAPVSSPTKCGFRRGAPLDEQPGDRCEGGGEVGVEERERRDVVDLQLAPGIEAVPAEPEQAGAERDERDVVRRVDELPLPDVEHGCERREAGARVHDDSAGEVARAPVRKQAAAPEHVHERVVDRELPDDEEEQIRLEGDAVREGAGDQRRRDDREHHLVGDQHGERNLRGRIDRVDGDAPQERVVEVPVDPVRAAAEAERVADEPPQDGGDPHRGEALDHDRQRVGAADKPTVEEGEPRRHQHHQARGEEHEARIRTADHGAILQPAAIVSCREVPT